MYWQFKPARNNPVCHKSVCDVLPLNVCSFIQGSLTISFRRFERATCSVKTWQRWNAIDDGRAAPQIRIERGWLSKSHRFQSPNFYTLSFNRTAVYVDPRKGNQLKWQCSAMCCVLVGTCLPWSSFKVEQPYWKIYTEGLYPETSAIIRKWTILLKCCFAGDKGLSFVTEWDHMLVNTTLLYLIICISGTDDDSSVLVILKCNL